MCGLLIEEKYSKLCLGLCRSACSVQFGVSVNGVHSSSGRGVEGLDLCVGLFLVYRFLERSSVPKIQLFDMKSIYHIAVFVLFRSDSGPHLFPHYLLVSIS